MKSIADALFDLAKSNRGEPGVLGTAAEGEGNLKEAYDRAIDVTHDPQGEDLLRRQREDVEFGEKVLREMSRASEKDPPDKEK